MKKASKMASSLAGLLFGLTMLSSHADADYVIKDGNAASQTILAFTCGTTKICPGYVPMDMTGAAMGVAGNPLFIAPGTGQTFPMSAAASSFAAGAFAAGSGVDGWNVTEGLKTDAACAGDNTSGCSIEARLQRIAQNLTTLNSTAALPIAAGTAIIGKVGIDQTTPGTTNGVQVNAALPAGTNNIGKVTPNDGTNSQVFDPCQSSAKTFLPITLTTSAVKVIATGVAAKKIYICQLVLSSGAADNVAIFEATTATVCATSPIAVYGSGTTVATAANGFQFAANGGISLGNGGNMVGQSTVANNDLCIATSAATPLSGGITFVTQ